MYKNVVKKDKLLGTMSHLTSSGHVVIGVSIHVGRDGDVREFAQNVDSFIRKPVEGVGGPRCTRSNALTRSHSLAHSLTHSRSRSQSSLEAAGSSERA